MDNSRGQENLFKYVNFESFSLKASSRRCFLKEISDKFLFPFTFRGHFNWVSQKEKTRATANESSGNFHRQPLRTLNRNTQTNKTPFYIKWEDGAGFSNKPSPYWSRPELSQNTFDMELTNYAKTLTRHQLRLVLGAKSDGLELKKTPWKPTSRYQANLRVDKVGVPRSRSLFKLSTVANLRY